MAFPTVAIIGSDSRLPLLISSATSLGIKVKHLADGDLTSLRQQAHGCDLITYLSDGIQITTAASLAHEGFRVRPSAENVKQIQNLSRFSLPSIQLPDGEWLLLVARSPHGQATTWAPTQVVRESSVLTLSPAPDLDAEALKELQKWSMEIAASIGAVGVIALVIGAESGAVAIRRIHFGPDHLGDWTVTGAHTNQYEQHMRALLDLPLGDPAMRSPYIVTSQIREGHKSDMYRPYLHLMARTPALKFHYFDTATADGAIGYVALSGSNISEMKEEITHARDYLSGLIDD